MHIRDSRPWKIYHIIIYSLNKNQIKFIVSFTYKQIMIIKATISKLRINLFGMVWDIEIPTLIICVPEI